jgi:hypothetical protein
MAASELDAVIMLNLQAMDRAALTWMRYDEFFIARRERFSGQNAFGVVDHWAWNFPQVGQLARWSVAEPRETTRKSHL